MWISLTFRCVTQNPCRAPLNPERGFQVQSEARASNYKPLTFPLICSLYFLLLLILIGFVTLPLAVDTLFEVHNIIVAH